ncbi:MAG: hypothetical protein GF398_05040 [Chitinivibrionales bacterium]|nr:hypothetical protein [Chitinivibrionales bacterium]
MQSCLKQSGCLLWVLLLFAGKASAQCDYAQNGYIFKHPYFEAKYWARTNQSIANDINERICSHKPTSFAITHDSSENVAAFFAGNGDFYLVSISSYQPPLNYPYVIEAMSPVKVDLSGVPHRTGTPIHLVKQPGYHQERVKLVMAGAADTVLKVLTIKADGSAVEQEQTLILSTLDAGQQVLFIAGDLNMSTNQDSGIWVGGTGGLLRYFSYDGTTFGSNQVFDISASETVTCFGDDYIGTASGRIFKKSGASFVQDSKPTAKAIRAISARGGAGDSGLILVNTGSWQAYTGGAASYHMVNFVKMPDGSAAEVVADDWVYQLHVYKDDPTRIVEVFPVELVNYLNRDTFDLSGLSSYQIELTLEDPDSNFAAPRLFIYNGGKRDTLDSDGAYILQNAAPGSECVQDEVNMQGNAAVVYFGDSFIELKTNAVRGKIVVGKGCSFLDYTFNARKELDSDTSYFMLTAGRDTIILFDDKHTGHTANAARVLHKMNPGTACDYAISGNGIAIINIDKNISPARLNLFTPNGNLATSISSKKFGSAIRLNLPAGIYYLQMIDTDGEPIDKPATLVVR